MTYEFTPKGVCSRKMTIEIEGDTVKSLSVLGGCNGNLKGISSLVKGMKIDDIIERLDGIDCGGKGTSCPAQLAVALKQYKAEQ
ncbi:MAG: TIGR03905 family TSCPD domain-containing protein [Ruminococcaceae bacterium]|nr:TIGR03905 family TSCPD domain-containing protein [Oscillospiraceae bacterium]MBD5117385.1 TIGR03905 family TSCPD domain-containing protein [Oscillospiraceae bacterium]